MKNLKIILAATASIAAMSTAHAQPKSITVAWYGGNWGEAFQACVATPFTEKTGIAVTAEIGTSTTTLAKLQQQSGAPTIDVAYMDGGISELAQAAGVLAPIDLAQLPNGQNLQPKAAYQAGDEVFAIGGGYYSLGLTYNTEEITKAPTSWQTLWDEDYAGAATIPSPNNSAGIPFMFFVDKMLGGNASDMTAAVEKIKELDAGLYFESSGAASNAFQSGEVVIGAHFSVGAWALIDSGLPIGFTIPSEGVWATDARLHLIKNAPNPEGALQFLDMAMSTEAAGCLAEKLYLGPAVKDTQLTAEVSKKLPWGENGSVDDLLLFDWNEINAKRAELTETWNREIAR